jgi:hypothetical protein
VKIATSKKLVLIAAFLFTGSAFADTTLSQIGNSWYSSDGRVYNKIGNTVYGSDGSSANRIGNTLYIKPSYSTSPYHLGTPPYNPYE